MTHVSWDKIDMRTQVVCVLLFVSAAFGIRVQSSTRGGRTLIENHVIGGVNAAEGAAPYQISLQSNGYHMCGGAIIGDRWVATAAHCILNYIYYEWESYLSVITGTNKYAEPGAIYYVDKLFINCNYDKPNYHNDIGLIRLNSSIVFNERTAKVSLPTAPLNEGDELILTGWGSTELWGDTPDDLQTVTLNFVPYEKCKADLGGDEGLGISHICTFTRVGEGACHGDSGGPLVHNGVLYGLVNWGRPCAIGSPDMHANVYYMVDWIRRQMSDCGGW